MISGHLQEMQEKFQQRFDKLEQEVRSRDEVITRLKSHISELERTLDDSFTTVSLLLFLLIRLNFIAEHY